MVTGYLPIFAHNAPVLRSAAFGCEAILPAFFDSRFGPARIASFRELLLRPLNPIPARLQSVPLNLPFAKGHLRTAQNQESKRTSKGPRKYAAKAPARYNPAEHHSTIRQNRLAVWHAAGSFRSHV